MTQQSLPGSPPPLPPQSAPNSGMAIASLILGIVSFPMIFACFLGIPAGIVGAILGHVSLKKIRQSGGTIGGEGLAKGGIICGWIGAGLGLLILMAYIVFFVFAISQEGGIERMME